MNSEPNLRKDAYNFRPSTSTIWSERGIDISKLETTDIPNTIRCRKWGNFILPRPQYRPEIVRDFYFALVPGAFEESGTVFVRGHKVVITAKLINEHFCTPNVPETNLMGCRTREEFFAKLDPRFVSKLRWDKLNQSLELLYDELHPEMALWTKFINHNLIPSKEKIITREVAQILFCIKSGIPIDVGRLIHKQICNAIDSDSSLLPFPSLITHFCLLSGVTVRGDLWPPLVDLGWVSYNSFAQKQGLPTLLLRKRHRVPTTPVQPQGRAPATPVQPQGRAPATPVQPPGRVLPTMPVQPPGRVLPTMPVQPLGQVPTTPMPVQPQGGVPTPVQLQYGNVDRPKWVNEITGRLNSLSDMIVSQYNGLSTQINNIGMRVTSLENAVRDEELDPQSQSQSQSQSHRRVRLRPTE